ncbi:MAG: hypothetical protein J5556_07085 [Deltaproteobacteria bacterium]|nr:hypothetical protein [Deltaproteobacteria bacterium]
MDEIMDKLALGLDCCVRSMKDSACPAECPYVEACAKGEIYEPLLKDIQAQLLPHAPRVLTLEEAKAATGAGWAEVWYEGDPDPAEDLPECRELYEAVFIGGHFLLSDGSWDKVTEENYNRPYGVRLWTGSRAPGDEHRAVIPWNG